MTMSDREMAGLVRMDDVRQLDVLHRIGAAAAEQQIRPGHFADAFTPGAGRPGGTPG